MRLRRADGVVDAHIDGQLVVLSPGMDFVALDSMGETIWRLTAEPTTVDDVVAQIVARFDVTEARCRADVQTFVSQMGAQGLLHVDG